MSKLHAPVDPDGLMEFSVVFTDRSLNHMSQTFQQVMRDINGMLKEVYTADHVALVPGGGTFAMEAVARQFGRDANVFVVRNGWFSYRWSQIFDAGDFTAQAHVMKPAAGQRAPRALSRPRRSRTSLPKSGRSNPMLSSPRMSKPARASSCPTTT